VVLVDSSVWIETFRKPRGLEIEKLIDFDDIVCCLPIYQEVLQGFRDEDAHRKAREALRAMPMIESPLSIEVFDQAADLYRSTRRLGHSVRSSVDCLIAACALRHNLEILHRDRDFAAIARVAPLRVREA
jgi:predicted nucleic acid-binding protein